MRSRVAVFFFYTVIIICFAGSEPDIVDFHFWPWFERIPMVFELNGLDLLPAKTFPKLTAWVDRMMQHPAVRATFLDAKLHAEFVKPYATNSLPNYDLGLD